MEKQEIAQKKRYGDAVLIGEIANRRRKEKGLQPYKERTIRAMLSGERTLKDDVKEASEMYYKSIDGLKNANV